METNNYDDIKTKIGDVYRKFQNAKDGVTIADIAQMFSINLDENRLQDYKITYINLSRLEIEIKDQQDQSITYAEYTTSAEIPKSNGPSQFIKVQKTYPDQTTIEELYEVGKHNQLLTSQVIVTASNFSIAFQKELPLFNHPSPNRSVVEKITYAISPNAHENTMKEELFTKVFSYTSKEDNPKSLDYLFHQTATITKTKRTDEQDNQNRYTYIYEDNVIMGIKELKKKNPFLYMESICFENMTDYEIDKYLPPHINEINTPELKMKEYLSGLTFNAYANDRTHHSLKIFKDKEVILVIYNNFKYVLKIKENGRPDFTQELLAFKNTHYPNLAPGTITALEVKNIVSILKLEFGKDPFIALACEEMLNFASCLNRRLGPIKEEQDELAPENFIHMSTEQIAKKLRTNRQKYFSTMYDQYVDLTNIKLPEDQKKLELH